MMKLWFGLLAVAVATVGMGQASQKRLDAIWSYANARLDQQMDVWFEDGDYPADIQLLRVASALRPDDYESWTNLGWMLENVDEYPAALAVYKDYAAENPQDPDGALPLGQYYFRKKQYALVPPVLAKAVDRTPHPHPNVFRILAHSYERLGKLSDSERVWKLYLSFAPKDDAARHNLQRVEEKLAAAHPKP